MIELLHQLFAVFWREEFVPPQWREGLTVNVLRRGIRKSLGTIGVAITLLSVVGKSLFSVNRRKSIP